MKIINLTPHAIPFMVNEGAPLVVEPSGIIARVSVNTRRTGELAGVPVIENVYEVMGLPQPKEDTIYVVSSLVAQRCKNRDDVFIPNEPVRDEHGRIIGCRSLGRV